MVIDGHAHACGIYSNVENVKRNLEQKGIDMVVLCAGERDSGKNYNYPMLSKIFKGQSLAYMFNKIIKSVVSINHAQDYIDEQNKKVSEMQQKLPDKIINAYWANPLDKNCMEKIENFYSENGFKLLKLHQCWTPFDVLSTESKAIILWAGKRDIPIFIHLLSEQQVINFVKAANEFKDTTFIVGHMIGYGLISERLKNKNVYFDLSAPQIYSESTLKSALKKIGYDRLILGSDSPYGLDNFDKVKNRLIKLALTEEESECIYGKNLQRILHLE